MRAYGIPVRSSDPRTASIEFDGAKGGLHACGYRVEGPTAWDASSAERAPSLFRFRKDAVPSATEQAEEAKPVPSPLLSGHTAGGSTSVVARGGTFRVGIMHPTRRERATTMVVAFADHPGRRSARIMERLPMRFDGIAAVPYVHSDAVVLNLDGRAADGSINRTVLDLRSDEQEAFASELPDPKE